MIGDGMFSITIWHLKTFHHHLVPENIPLPIMWWLKKFQSLHDWQLKLFDHQAYNDQKFSITITKFIVGLVIKKLWLLQAWRLKIFDRHTPYNDWNGSNFSHP